MELRSLTEEDYTGKSVLVRTDFNLEKTSVGRVKEHFKLKVAKKTLDHILSQKGSKVAIISHLGNPGGKKDPELSLQSMVPALEQSLGRKIVFVSDCVGESVAQALAALPEGQLLLLENPRFYPGEEQNDPEFAKQLAAPFAAYVNEAFSVCHRDHASVTGITKVLPFAAGFRVQEEVEELSKAKDKPVHPAIAVVGGAKIETKLPLIQALEKNYECILVGGKVANEALDQKIAFSEKVLLPVDFDGPDRLDIGPKTISFFTQILKTANMVIWNGPLGKFEEKPHDSGTLAVLNALLEGHAYVVIGGGESLTLVEEAGVVQKIGFVSTGGGAMLEFLGGQPMPGLEVLKKA